MGVFGSSLPRQDALEAEAFGDAHQLVGPVLVIQDDHRPGAVLGCGGDLQGVALFICVECLVAVERNVSVQCVSDVLSALLRQERDVVGAEGTSPRRAA
ncbi:hypothetical protein SB659_16155 [Arthrobacter sp. SIMBA_036]|uniref:hypothetical protein n=1 Tax=Arthrobacter sp. SIMBA_036 TaxID=3085778 RepID=UPI00397961EF